MPTRNINTDLQVNSSAQFGSTSYGGNMNGGKADLSVDCGGTPQISWIGNYLQAGSTDQNWAMRLYTGVLHTYSQDLYITAGGTGTTSKLRLGTNGQTSTMVFDDGNVGIGTTSPSYKLEVDGTFSSNSLWTDSSANTYWGSGTSVFGILTWNTGYASVKAAAGNDLRLGGNNSSTHMAIDTSGNVGIGTTSPSSLLHLSAGTSGDAVLIIEADTDNNNELDNPYIHFKQDGGINSAKVGLGPANGGAFTDALANAVYLGHDTSGSPLQLYTDGAARLTITSAGNVGIGTTTPYGNLNINTGTSGVTTNISSQLAGSWSFGNQSGGSAAPTLIGKSNNNVGAIFIGATNNSNTAGDMHFNVRENDGTDFSTTSSIAFKFQRYATDLMTILRNGNVGIGTTSPDYRLDIGGDTASSSNTLRMVQANGGTAIRVGAGGGSNDVTLLRVDGNSTNFKGESDSGNFGFSLRYKGSGSGNGNSLAFFSDNQTASQVEALTIMQDGSVGIGAATPLGKLHIYQSNNNEDALVLKGGGDSGSVQGECSLSMSHFSSDSNPAVRITTQEIDNGDYRANLLFFVRGVNSNSEPTEKMRITYTGDAEITTASKGLILKSPNGSRFRIVVNDSGELSTSSV